MACSNLGVIWLLMDCGMVVEVLPQQNVQLVEDVMFHRLFCLLYLSEKHDAEYFLYGLPSPLLIFTFTELITVTIFQLSSHLGSDLPALGKDSQTWSPT